MRKLRAENRELDEQGLHYEYMVRKYRPDLDPEKLEAMREKVKTMQPGVELNRRVLEETGLLRKA